MAGVAGPVRAKGKERPERVRRARVVTLAPSGRVAMIERYVRGHRYLSVPGGRMEPGETPEEAAIREIEEELGLAITLAGRLPDHDGQAYFLAVVPEEAKLRMSGPEIKHSSRSNRYTPRWVDAATLDGLPLRQPVRSLVTTAALAVAAAMQVSGAVQKKSETKDGAVSVDLGQSPEVPSEDVLVDLSAAHMPGPRAEADPAAATFAFGHTLRRRFTFRGRGRSRSDYDRIGSSH
ncbi:NUDIX domain-containing protein [Kineosporia sp. NBRC 101677]|uniref:NUDIX domain-containing protein n=1 Tax=Kineosporia sp. NBRC 101677 TaxID=3032197 RepID=UPI002556E214|nr:NUDIX domain-containing protein [Kineosporia sp. NBRC 101677]